MRVKVEIVSEFETRIVAHPPLSEKNYGTFHAIEEEVKGFAHRHCTDMFAEIICEKLKDGKPTQQYVFLECRWENDSSRFSENYDEGWYLDIVESEDQKTEIKTRRRGKKCPQRH